MRFTEHELTVAVQAAAKAIGGAQAGRRVDPEDAWEALTKLERYQLISGVGDQLLPALLELPDVEVESGTQPTFTEDQVREAVESTMEASKGRLRRKAELAARMQLMFIALAALPVRQDPDALIVPDTLEGLEGF